MKLIIDMPDYADVKSILKATENSIILSTYLKDIKKEIENIDLFQDRANEQSWSEKHGKSPLDIKKEALSILDKYIKENSNEHN